MIHKNLLWAMMSFSLITGVATSQAYVVGIVQNGGSIQGHVTLLGTPPSPSRFQVDKNPEFCGKERSLHKVEVHDGFLTGVVMVLEGVDKGKPFLEKSVVGEAPGEGRFHYQGGESLGLQVKTKGCNFGPYTGVVASDQSIQFSNHDSIKHTLHTFVSMGSRGNVLRTVHNQDLHPDTQTDRVFRSGKLKDSRVVRFACNRHDFMENWLYVVKNPYYAMSDEEGQFKIDDIPPGSYTLRAWHPVLGLQEQKVEVKSDESFLTDFTFSK